MTTWTPEELARVGVRETNPQSDADRNFNPTRTVDWTEPGLYITRLRMVSDPGYPEWDITYCHGTLGDEQVRVSLPFSTLPKANMKRALYKHAKASGAFIKGLFDNISTLE
jgi:hypothetical protein